MAIDFHLELGAPATPERVAGELLALAVEGGLLPAGTEATDLLGPGAVLRAGAWCKVVAANNPFPWPPPVEADFGIVRTCWVAFRLDLRSDAVRPQQDEMVWLCSGLLARLPGDAALHSDYEVLWLLRKEGRLLVSDRDDIWTAERLAMLPQPYERAHLAFSDVPDG